MSQEWMLDLLKDLRVVAQKQAMYEVAEHLDDVAVLVAREVRISNACIAVAGPDDELDGDISRAVAERDTP